MDKKYENSGAIDINKFPEPLAKYDLDKVLEKRKHRPGYLEIKGIVPSAKTGIAI